MPKLIVISIIFTTLAIFAIFTFNMLRSNHETPPAPEPTSTPTPSPESMIPSPYANDDQVLAIEKSLQELENELTIVNFREDTLSLPTLDWNITFK